MSVARVNAKQGSARITRPKSFGNTRHLPHTDSDKGEVGSFNSRHIFGAARAEGETGASLSSKLLHITGNNQGTYVKNSHQKQQSCQAPTSVLAPAPGHLSVPTARASTQSGTSQFSTAAPSIWIEPKAFPIPPSIPECIRLYTREPLYRT
jgi:hypothetical protein